MGILCLETGSNARPSRVYYDQEDSSFASIMPGSLNWESLLNDVDWFHWTSITPALSENAACICFKAIRTVNRLGVIVLCDINYRGNLWKYGKSGSEVMPEEMVAGSDIILGNEEDFEKVLGD